MNIPINKYLILLLLPLAGFALCYFLQYLSHIEYRYGDTEIFVNAAFSYLHEAHLYQKPYLVAPMDPSFKFPPIYALPYTIAGDITDYVSGEELYKRLFWPLTWLHIIRYVLSLALIVAFFGPWKNLTWPLIASIVFFVAAPFDEALTGLTFSNLFLFVLVLSFILLRLQWKWTPAILLSYVCMAKLYPITIIIFFIARKDWSFLLRFFTSCIVLKGISLLYFGIAVHKNFHFKILPILLREDVVLSISNRSIYSFYAIEGPLSYVYKFLFITLTMLTIFFANRKRKMNYRDNNVALMFGLSICAVLLVLQNCWGQYQLILLFPILILIGSAFDKTSLWRSFRIFAAVLAWLPLTIGYVSVVFAPEEVAKINHLIFMRDFSPLILWVTLALLLLADAIRTTYSWDTFLFPKVLAKE